MLEKKIIQLFGVAMHVWTMEETTKIIKQRLADNVFTQHVVVNVAKLVNMQTDTALFGSVKSCDIVNIDGAGVVFGGRILGMTIPERVAGIDLFHKLLLMAEQNGHSVYFLGAKDQVIEKTVQQIKRGYPLLNLAGYHHGYFWDREEDVVRAIATSGADMLFVAITSPNKENFINKWKAQLGVKFVMGVGGTFDVVAGKVKRAPVWMQNNGLEWIYRIFQEPQRMWKRYLITNSKFLFMILKGLINKDYRNEGIKVK